MNHHPTYFIHYPSLSLPLPFGHSLQVFASPESVHLCSNEDDLMTNKHKEIYIENTATGGLLFIIKDAHKLGGGKKKDDIR